MILDEAHWPSWRDVRLDPFLPGVVELRLKGRKPVSGDGVQLRELRLRVEDGELPRPVTGGR